MTINYKSCKNNKYLWQPQNRAEFKRVNIFGFVDDLLALTLQVHKTIGQRKKSKVT